MVLLAVLILMVCIPNGLPHPALYQHVQQQNCTTIKSLAAGNGHSVALLSNGSVYAWGYNHYGQLGDNTTSSSTNPVQVEGLLSGRVITSIAAGDHTLALSSDGTIYSWGFNGVGQLGDNTTSNQLSPVLLVDANNVFPGRKFIAVYAGLYHSATLSNDGEVIMWGYNKYGQLGDGTNVSSTVPLLVDTNGVLNGKKVVQLALGGFHTVALSDDGLVFTWGRNNLGQLGDNTTETGFVPILVYTGGVLSGLSITQAAAGYSHTVVLSSTGSIYWWGLGVDTVIPNMNLPATLVDPSDALAGHTVTSVAAATNSSYAFGSDGTLFAWGYNVYGELGDGTTTDRSAPGIVPTNGSVVQVQGGLDYHVLAVTGAGTLIGWGANSYGQLGVFPSKYILEPTPLFSAVFSYCSSLSSPKPVPEPAPGGGGLTPESSPKPTQSTPEPEPESTSGRTTSGVVLATVLVSLLLSTS